MKIRLETYENITVENCEKWGEEFFSDIFFSACKFTELYQQDDNIKWFTDKAEDLAGKVKSLKGSWELGVMMGTLVGNLYIGGENLANRLMETIAVKEIGEILCKNLQEMSMEDLKSIIGTKKEREFVQKYVTTSQFLVACRVRGEYCWYSIIANDAGLASWFNKETGKKAEDIYNKLVELIQDIQNKLNAITTIVKNNKTEIQQELIGEWEIDVDYTKNYNNMSMWDFYGTSIKYGNKMSFNKDGSFSYYAAWCYGKGTFDIKDESIILNLSEGDPELIKLTVISDGVIRIGLDQYLDGKLVFWTKK